MMSFSNLYVEKPLSYLGLIVAIIFGLTLSGCDKRSAEIKIRYLMATGSTSGTYYAVGIGMSKIVSDANSDISIDGITSGGSTENIRLIENKEVDFGISNGVVSFLAVNGVGRFERQPQNEIRSLMALWENTEHQLVLSSDLKTGTVDDLSTLSGKYNIGKRRSGARTAATLMLKALGHDTKEMTLELSTLMRLMKFLFILMALMSQTINSISSRVEGVH